MEFYKPVFKENDLAMYETINKQFLNTFKNPLNGNPKLSIETCDLHLEQKQPFMFVDPKGNPIKEITWNEPKDMELYWQGKIKNVWALVSFASGIFAFILYYSGLISFV